MTPLAAVRDAARFGGKAAALGAAVRAGLPVPDGVALGVDDVAQLLADAAAWRPAIQDALAAHGPLAVRSSAVDEDGATASFAGVHLSVLGPSTVDAVIEAIRAVEASARTPAARVYRARVGASGSAETAVLLQRLVQPRVAGVLFSRDPRTGADLRCIEASWGLGEAVVAGLVVPDRFILGRDGCLRARTLGDKDVEVVVTASGTTQVAVEPARHNAPCLDGAALLALAQLADAVEATVGPAASRGLDIEFACDHDGRLWLLQHREVTR